MVAQQIREISNGVIKRNIVYTYFISGKRTGDDELSIDEQYTKFKQHRR
jgi:hypothetical protein